MEVEILQNASHKKEEQNCVADCVILLSFVVFNRLIIRFIRRAKDYWDGYDRKMEKCCVSVTQRSPSGARDARMASVDWSRTYPGRIKKQNIGDYRLASVRCVFLNTSKWAQVFDWMWNQSSNEDRRRPLTARFQSSRLPQKPLATSSTYMGSSWRQ